MASWWAGEDQGGSGIQGQLMEEVPMKTLSGTRQAQKEEMLQWSQYRGTIYVWRRTEDF